ncbi:CHC2 zinc finger domain-containing protein [bacterium]|nr:CHC2 zinc finger domain-containing protein [bacterium]
MYSQDEIDRIKAENPPTEVALSHNLELKRQGSDWLARCPFHSEKTPSLNIYADHAHCYGCGWSGDSIKLEADLSGLSFPDACSKLGATESETPEDEAERLKRIEERRQRQEQAEAERREKNKAKRARWPQLYVGRTHDLQEVADLRGIDYAGPWLAQELGHLRFARWRDQLAWIVGDRSAAAARRLDGKLWEHGTPHKSDTLPGSEKHPIGLTNSSLPVILIEGEADYLATLARLWQQGQYEAWQVVCMLGAGARLGRHATKLRGRQVTIYAHGEKAGQAAADRWKEEASLAGAKSIKVCALPDGQDVNDLTVKEVAV